YFEKIVCRKIQILSVVFILPKSPKRFRIPMKILRVRIFGLRNAKASLGDG
ncbi:MAG: hypothetical protein ACI8PD_002107, partial [Nitrospinales bacterium]